MTDLNEKLIAYASGQMGDNEAVEIETVLIRYVDQTLDSADADEIDRIVDKHPNVAAIVDEAMAGKRWFEETLATELHPIVSNAGASPELQDLIETLAKAPSSTDEKDQNPPSIIPSFFGVQGRYALAASIALALLIGGFSYINMINGRLDSEQNIRARLEQDLERQTANQEQQLAEVAALKDRVENYEQQLTGASDEQASVQVDLTDTKQELRALQSERSDLEQQLAASLNELETMPVKAEEIEELRAALDAANAAEQNTAEDHQRAIKALDDEIAELSAALKGASEARETANERRINAELIVASLRTEALGRERDIEEIQELLQRRTSDLDDRELQIMALTDQITDLDTKLTDATQRIAALQAKEQATTLAAEQSPKAPMPNWLDQVAGYYRLYAKQPRRHLVEVKADEQQHIEKWLGEQLGRPVLIPDLSEGGMEFQGARLLAINGMPVAQLTYLDADDEPLAFCFMRNRSGEKKELEITNADDLNLVDWRDQAYQYVVVGSSTFTVLEALAQGLDESYRDDI